MQILALHGFTGRGSDFAPFAALVGGEWNCPDLPGHGPDPQLNCSPEATVQFVEKARTAPPQPSVLLGYSMGARAALQHAINNPHAWSALVLISPNPGIEYPAERAARRATDAKLADRIERDGVESFIEFWQQTPMIRSQQTITKEWRESMDRARAEHTAEGLASSLRQFGQGNCPDLWPQLDSLKLPVLILTGALDRKYTQIAERMRESSSPILQMRELPHAGHMPHLEQAEASAEIIKSFLYDSLNKLI